MKELPVSPMFPAGAVAPYGRPSMGTNEQQEMGAPAAVPGPDSNPNGSNPAVGESVAAFGNGPDVRAYGSCPHANPTPEMPGA